ncbi:MAG: hydroxyacid dehydrogenase [Nitrospinota bacterium]
MSNRPVIFVPEPRKPMSLLRELLEPHGEVRVGGPEKWTEDDLTRGIPEWDAILVTSREQVTERVIQAGTRLKIVAKFGVGVENIDIPAATRAGLPVTNCPGSNAIAVAEAALGLILASVRRIPSYMKSLQGGAWREVLVDAIELSGATFGIVGIGNVGRELARLLRGFDGRILAFDPYVPPDEIRARGAEPVDLDTLTRESDVISLHCSLTHETRHLFGADRFQMMKSQAVIVNCSRGPVIDEKALVGALRENVIAAAGIDVFEGEPPEKDHPLFSLPNAVVTPHLAGSTHLAHERVFRMVSDSIIRVLKGERPNPVMLRNPEVYGKIAVLDGTVSSRERS